MQDLWRLGKHRGKWCAVTGTGNNRVRRVAPGQNVEDAKSFVRDLNREAERLTLP